MYYYPTFLIGWTPHLSPTLQSSPNAEYAMYIPCRCDYGCPNRQIATAPTPKRRLRAVSNNYNHVRPLLEKLFYLIQVFRFANSHFRNSAHETLVYSVSWKFLPPYSPVIRLINTIVYIILVRG